MWNMYLQRKIDELTVLGDHDTNATRRVFFGTKADKYTEFIEKYGFMSRRAIKNEDSWQDKSEEYEDRLQERNPRLGKLGGKNMKNQSRMDEINEESGLRVKHAPSILMINRYIKSKEDFFSAYTSGAQGTGTGIARPDHVTDLEIYRMFSGKSAYLILGNTLFADDTLKRVKIGKAKNNWWNNNRVSRMSRINNTL